MRGGGVETGVSACWGSLNKLKKGGGQGGAPRKDRANCGGLTKN